MAGVYPLSHLAGSLFCDIYHRCLPSMADTSECQYFSRQTSKSFSFRPISKHFCLETLASELRLTCCKMYVEFILIYGGAADYL